jgi:hypothetical protein
MKEEKRLLAKELIANYSGFVKKLMRDNMGYLFG